MIAPTGHDMVGGLAGPSCISENACCIRPRHRDLIDQATGGRQAGPRHLHRFDAPTSSAAPTWRATKPWPPHQEIAQQGQTELTEMHYAACPDTDRPALLPT